MRAPSSRAARATAGDKIEAMRSAGISVADLRRALGTTLVEVLDG